MRDGPAAGLTLIGHDPGTRRLGDYYWAHSHARSLSAGWRTAEARAAYLEALARVQQGPERRFLEQQWQPCRLNRPTHEFSKLVGPIVDFARANDYLM